MYGLDLSAAFFAAGVIFSLSSALISYYGLKEAPSKSTITVWHISSFLLAIVVLVNFVLYSGMVLK